MPNAESSSSCGLCLLDVPHLRKMPDGHVANAALHLCSGGTEALRLCLVAETNPRVPLIFAALQDGQALLHSAHSALNDHVVRSARPGGVDQGWGSFEEVHEAVSEAARSTSVAGSGYAGASEGDLTACGTRPFRVGMASMNATDGWRDSQWFTRLVADISRHARVALSELRVPGRRVAVEVVIIGGELHARPSDLTDLEIIINLIKRLVIDAVYGLPSGVPDSLYKSLPPLKLVLQLVRSPDLRERVSIPPAPETMADDPRIPQEDFLKEFVDRLSDSLVDS